MPQGLTVTCDNEDASGKACGALAVVLKAQYKYDTLSFPKGRGFGPELVEVRYQIECPKCGTRKQVEKAPSKK